MIQLQSKRLIIRQVENKDIPAIISFYSINSVFLKSYEPKRKDSFYTSEFWKNRLFEEKNSGTIRFFLFKNDEPDKIIGTVSISSIIRSAFHAGYIGYALSENEQGSGYMTEALNSVINFAFSELNLHRLMANCMASNDKSLKLLSNIGFEVEGKAKKYLLINGNWEDHVLTSLVNKNWIDE
jgi:ribosomal-protein-alanine N-acetyltransferase